MSETGKGKENIFGGVRIVAEVEGEDPFSQLFEILNEPIAEERTEGKEDGGEEKKSEFQMQLEYLLLLTNGIDQMEEGAEKLEGKKLLADLIKDLYSGLTQEYRPALKHLLPIIGELLGKDLNLLLLPILKLSNEVGESEEVQEERQRGRENRAKARKAIFDAYIKTGFTPDQAMTLLLHDIAPSGLSNVVATAALAAVDKASGPVPKVTKEE
jgi:hypothetical protein